MSDLTALLAAMEEQKIVIAKLKEEHEELEDKAKLLTSNNDILLRDQALIDDANKRLQTTLEEERNANSHLREALEKANSTMSKAEKSLVTAVSSTGASADVQCVCCFDNTSEIFYCPSGHPHCADCISQHIQSLGFHETVKCMSPDCSACELGPVTEMNACSKELWGKVAACRALKAAYEDRYEAAGSKGSKRRRFSSQAYYLEDIMHKLKHRTPCCSTPYVAIQESGECGAINCKRCSTYFCAYCHKLFSKRREERGEGAHEHVMRCVLNPGSTYGIDTFKQKAALYSAGNSRLLLQLCKALHVDPPLQPFKCPKEVYE